MNVDPAQWGPSLWRSLHSITLGYPENPTDIVKKHTHNLFTSLQYVLPCEKCRVNFNHQLTTSPLTDTIISSRQSLITWLIDIHNEVNKSLGKRILSQEEALKLYTENVSFSYFSFTDLIKTIDFRILTIVITIIIIIVLLIIFRIRHS